MKNSVADPFPCPEKEWVFKRPFSRSIQSFFKATPCNESCGVFVQLCGIALRQHRTISLDDAVKSTLNVIDCIKFAKNECAAVL